MSRPAPSDCAGRTGRQAPTAPAKDRRI